jgi:putative endonuclease
MGYYVYLLETSDSKKSIYTGYTGQKLQQRLYQHNKGYTKSLKWRLPVKLVYFEQYRNKEKAMLRELEIKRMSRQQKLRLIEKKGVINEV